MRGLVIVAALFFGVVASSNAAYFDSVTNLNPVSYWRLNETSGTNTSDTVGNNDGVYAAAGGIIGDVGIRPPAYPGLELDNKAMYGDGGTNGTYVRVTDNASVSITGALTLEAWIYPESDDNDQILSKFGYSDGNDYSWKLWREGNNERIFFGVSGTGTNWTDLATVELVPTGQWCHVVAVFEPSVSIAIYINGAIAARNTNDIPATIHDSSANVTIGAYEWGSITAPTAQFGGKIDEVAIYDKALTEQQVATHYFESKNDPNNTCIYSEKVMSYNPVAYWRLNETDGTGALNQMGINHGMYYNYGSGGGKGALGAAGPRPSSGFDGFDADNHVPHANGDTAGYGDPVWYAQDSASLSITGALTVSVWINPDSLAKDGEIASKYRYSGGNDYSWRLYQLKTSGRVGFRVSSGGSAWDSTGFSDATTGSAPTGSWTHVTAVFNPGDSVKVYLNGTYSGGVSTSVTDLYDSGADISTSRYWGGPRYNEFNGRVDEVAIFDKALTATQVQQLHEASHQTPTGSSTILSLRQYSSNVLEMVVACPWPPTSYPLMKTDLVAGSWARVGHSTNGVSGTFITTNLDYSVVSGTNQVIYLQSADSATFFGIGEE